VSANAIAWPNQPLGITQTTSERKWVQECFIRRAFVAPRVCDDLVLDRHCRIAGCHSVAQRVKPELVRAFPPDCNRVVCNSAWCNMVGGWLDGWVKATRPCAHGHVQASVRKSSSSRRQHDGAIAGSTYRQVGRAIEMNHTGGDTQALWKNPTTLVSPATLELGSNCLFSDHAGSSMWAILGQMRLTACIHNLLHGNMLACTCSECSLASQHNTPCQGLCMASQHTMPVPSVEPSAMCAEPPGEHETTVHTHVHQACARCASYQLTNLMPHNTVCTLEMCTQANAGTPHRAMQFVNPHPVLHHTHMDALHIASAHKPHLVPANASTVAMVMSVDVNDTTGSVPTCTSLQRTPNQHVGCMHQARRSSS
jgi:hypothetical protein